MTLSVHGLAATLVLLSLAAGPGLSFGQTVWDGPPVAFSKPNFADWTLAENQDRITPGTWITRQDTQGLFNIASEPGFGAGSPANTEWATVVLNPGETVAAANFANLQFADWRTAVNSAPPAQVGQPAVVHLIAEDIYLDLTLTAWTAAGTGGGFSYTRSSAPAIPMLGPAGAVWLALGLGATALAALRRGIGRRARSR